MKNKIFTTLITLFFFLGSYAQETFNVPPDSALNEFIANNKAESGLSTYVLARDGYYILTGSMNFSGDIAIVAEEGDGARPIVIMGTNDEGASAGWGMLWTDGSIYYEGINWKVTNVSGARGPWSSALFSTSGSNITIEMIDCIVEYSDGVSVWNESGTGVTLIMRDNLFRLNGFPEGGPWQGFGSLLKNGSLEMAIIENNTFVENYSCLFIHENGHIKNAFFNHNTIVSNGQGALRYMYADRAVCMNNLFVDAHFGGETPQAITGQDQEDLPMGVYGLDYYRSGDTVKPAGYPAEENRINVVAYNANYVSPELKTYWESQVDTFLVADFTKGDNGFLNDRAMKMMKSEGDFNYPMFEWDDNLSVFTADPQFTDYTVKVQDEIEISEHLNGFDSVVPETVKWGTYPKDDGNASFPLAWDYYSFSYSNADYQKAAHGGYPLGDLNWFPDEKALWEVDPEKENYDDIIADVMADETFEFVDWANKVGINDRRNSQIISAGVYPNPAEGAANLNINLKNNASVNMAVYNVFGQEVMHIIDQKLTAGNHTINFDVTALPAGTYIYKVTVGNDILANRFVVK